MVGTTNRKPSTVQSLNTFGVQVATVIVCHENVLICRPDSEVTSTVSIQTPEHLVEANPVVWKGDINMPDVAKFSVMAHQVMHNFWNLYTCVLLLILIKVSDMKTSVDSLT